MKQYKNRSKQITVLALLLAMQIVLSRFLSISALNVKIGFSFLPVVFVAIMFRPTITAGFYAIADILGAVLFPIGAFFPGFTLTAAISGLIIGYGLNKNRSISRIILVFFINMVICSMLLNTYWITVITGIPFDKMFISRSLAFGVNFAVQVLSVVLLEKSGVFKRLLANVRI